MSTALAAPLQALGQALVVLAATGGREVPAAAVNPRQVRDFARPARMHRVLSKRTQRTCMSPEARKQPCANEANMAGSHAYAKSDERTQAAIRLPASHALQPFTGQPLEQTIVD